MIYLIICIIGISYIILNTYLIKISFNEIKANIKNEFTFIHISDIHGTLRFLNGSLCSIINRLSPDFVVVTGDLSNTREQLPKVLTELSNIAAKNGVFIVLGNYEGQEIRGFRKRNTDINDSIRLIEDHSALTLLKNEYCLLDINGNQVLIYGFDNSTYSKAKYDKSIDLLENDYKIILAHSPSIIKIIDELNISSNQVLVGHTHGGQINILNSRRIGDYSDFHIGVKEHNDTLFCINRGLGTVKIPVRVNCYPEISVYNVMPK